MGKRKIFVIGTATLAELLVREALSTEEQMTAIDGLAPRETPNLLEISVRNPETGLHTLGLHLKRSRVRYGKPDKNRRKETNFHKLLARRTSRR